jgi:hypothetical protein
VPPACLSCLQELDVSSNRLSSLPASLGSLSKLKVLQADANSIAAVPGELLQGCSALHTLSLHSNPITPAQLESTPGYQEYDARRRYGAACQHAGELACTGAKRSACSLADDVRQPVVSCIPYDDFSNICACTTGVLNRYANSVLSCGDITALYSVSMQHLMLCSLLALMSPACTVVFCCLLPAEASMTRCLLAVRCWAVLGWTMGLTGSSRRHRQTNASSLRHWCIRESMVLLPVLPLPKGSIATACANLYLWARVTSGDGM